MKRVEYLEAKQVYDLWSSEIECLKIIDLRPEYDFNQARIPGAESQSLEQARLSLRSMDMDKLYVVVWDMGTNSLHEIKAMLNNMNNVVYLKDGFSSWKDKAFPIAPMKL